VLLRIQILFYCYEFRQSTASTSHKPRRTIIPKGVECRLRVVFVRIFQGLLISLAGLRVGGAFRFFLGEQSGVKMGVRKNAKVRVVKIERSGTSDLTEYNA
jgi:hypothetical protein